MNARALMDDLAARGASLAAEGTALHVEAPEGVLTPEDLEALRAAKADVVALLTRGRLPDLVYRPGEVPAWCAVCGCELVNQRFPRCPACRRREYQPGEDWHVDEEGA